MCSIFNPLSDLSGLSDPDNLTESSKSPASIARSNKQWVGTWLG